MDNIPDVNDWLNGDDEDSQETTRGGSYGSNNASSSKSDDSPDSIAGKYSSIDDAFADLEGL